MNIILHRRQNTVGGNIVEITSEQARIILDCGKAIVAEETGNPDITELFGGEPAVDAVFLSHYHTDHAGYIDMIPAGIPVYIGGGAGEILRIILGASGHPADDDITYAGKLRDSERITVKDINITPFLCDHSAFDSYMLLIESGNESVLYTGDFRSNGRKSFPALLRKLPEKIGTLICEGTCVGRENGHRNMTEAELEKEVRSIIAKLPPSAPVFVLQPSTNIDRLVTMYRAAKSSGRVFLEDVHTAEIASSAGGSIPNPQTFGDVYAFMSDGREESRAALLKFDQRAGKSFAASHPFVMCVRASMRNYMVKLAERLCMENGVLIYSMWQGYKEEVSVQAFLETCRGLGLTVYDLHCSGHADAEAIAALVSRVSPDTVIPVHTENAEWFARRFPGINVIEDGKMTETAVESD